MNHIGLFEGIGGFSLAARWMGWETIATCEINDFCNKILKYHFPYATKHYNIKTTDFTIYRGKCDILTGGFPCQPFSLAGKRKGTEDDRYLWEEMLRAIREIQPPWIVGENVYGLINWNNGMVFEQIISDLEAEGYEVAPVILPACSVDAPHKRYRIWFIAYFDNKRTSTGYKQVSGTNEKISKRNKNTKFSYSGIASNTTGTRLERSLQRKSILRPKSFKKWIAANSNSGRQSGEKYWEKESGQFAKESFSNYWKNFPTQSPICSGDDGIFAKSHGITISENRNNMDRNLVTKLCLEEGRLKVDFNTGKVYSLKQRGKEGQEIELKGSDCNGYIVHGIRYNGFKIQLRAHQIVWIAANGLYDKQSLMIDHINRDKKDNRLENLRLVDAKGNRENATEYKGKLTDKQKDMMVWLHKEDGIPIRELAEDFGISKSRVHQIILEHTGIYGITFPKWRNESIKAYGNAVVPQLVLQIFKAIEKFNKTI